MLVEIEDLVGDRDCPVIPVGPVDALPGGFVPAKAHDDGLVVVGEHSQDPKTRRGTGCGVGHGLLTCRGSDVMFGFGGGRPRVVLLGRTL